MVASKAAAESKDCFIRVPYWSATWTACMERRVDFHTSWCTWNVRDQSQSIPGAKWSEWSSRAGERAEIGGNAVFVIPMGRHKSSSRVGESSILRDFASEILCAEIVENQKKVWKTKRNPGIDATKSQNLSLDSKPVWQGNCMYIVYIVYREHVRRMCENLCVWGGRGWETYVYEGWNPSVKTRTHTSEVVGKIHPHCVKIHSF